MSFLKRLFKASKPRAPGPEEGLSRPERGLLTGKNVLITGAVRNIGRAIALEMAEEGARIFFTDIDEEGIRGLEQELQGRGCEARGFLSDVSSTDHIDSLTTLFVRERIPLHTLVSNAALTRGHADPLRVQPEKWRKLFDTNLIGPAYLASKVAGMMGDLGIRGSLIFLTSIHDRVIAGQPDYSSSKAAVSMLVRELAVELAPRDIRVNGIAPGLVTLGTDKRPRPHEYTLLGGQAVHPAYIGRAAVYLASDYFSHSTTGTILVVDGGLSLFNHRIVEGPLR